MIENNGVIPVPIDRDKLHFVPRLKRDDAETILALADSDMDVGQAAKKLWVHRNTVTYRIERIRKNTLLDACNFYDLIKLVQMARAAA